MARKKKRKKRSIEKKDFEKGNGIFNSAFNGLAVLKKRKNEAFKGPVKQEPVKRDQKEDESQYFLEAMSDVKPLPRHKEKIERLPNLNARPSHPVGDEDLEVVAWLSDLVTGIGEMDISFSDEYIEGAIQGFSPRLMKKLKNGQFPIQDYIDLHGLTKSGAEMRVRDFLLQSHGRGLRCVLVVHGRGLNSENHIPVLKERLPVWLNRGKVKKIVLAFSTAKPYDGGTGAIYILLRRRKK